MSTAEEMNYHDGPNKPVTMIMVRVIPLFRTPLNSCHNQDSFAGRQDFDKSWLSGAKKTVLRLAVGKACDGVRYDVKCEVRRRYNQTRTRRTCL
jgi:hypothetical protein